MNLYRVMLVGNNLVTTIDGAEVPMGFVKNEYVLAGSEADAIHNARQRVQRKLARNRTMRLRGDEAPSITFEEVEVGVPLWKLLTRENFVFYRLDIKRGRPRSVT